MSQERQCATCGGALRRLPLEAISRWKARRYCSKLCTGKRPRASLSDRFWAKVRKGDGCWTWNGAKAVWNYGLIWVDPVRRYELAHRVSWELANGPIPPEMIICHHCDNPRCVRPDHLFLGTPADNVRDKLAKGRGRVGFGERQASHKLTEDDVLNIRTLYPLGALQSDLAKAYGVRANTISSIIKRKYWKHLP